MIVKVYGVESMTLQVKQFHTVSDFEAYRRLPENADRLFELIDGEIVEVSPRLRHGRAASTIHGHIFMYLQQNPIGEVMFEVDHQLPDDEDNARLPDVSYVTNERLAMIDPDNPVPFMPDLAVEVKSPSNYVKGLRGLREKALYYLSNGSRLVWLVYPDRETAEACTIDDDGGIQFIPLSKSDVLEGADVLPGFSLPLKTVFRNK
jgi:Uma2 family endonuclease